MILGNFAFENDDSLNVQSIKTYFRQCNRRKSNNKGFFSSFLTNIVKCRAYKLVRLGFT